jgi:RNA polymerase sigma factor (sigma-70 family)
VFFSSHQSEVLSAIDKLYKQGWDSSAGDFAIRLHKNPIDLSHARNVSALVFDWYRAFKRHHAIREGQKNFKEAVKARRLEEQTGNPAGVWGEAPPTPEEVLEQKEQLARFNHAYKMLTENQRRVVDANWAAGPDKKQAKVAEELGMNYETYRVTLRYTLTKINDYVEGKTKE